MNDLYKNKSEQLLNFCKAKGFVSKANIMEWGLRNYLISADRYVRRWVAKGLMRRLSKDEVNFRGLRGKMAWYCCERT